MSEQPPPESPPEPPEPPVSEPEAPPAAPEPGSDHPIQLIVNDDLRRTRLTVFFRYILAIPHYLTVLIWRNAIYPVAFVNWFITLFAGQTPGDLHLFIGRYVRYQAQLSAYLTLLADPYPKFFGRAGEYPIDVAIADRRPQNRWLTLFRLILGIPAFVLAYVFSIATFVVAVIAWFVALALGRMPKGMRDLLAYFRRYRTQTDAYVYLLTDRYPSLSGPRT